MRLKRTQKEDLMIDHEMFSRVILSLLDWLQSPVTKYFSHIPV